MQLSVEISLYPLAEKKFKDQIWQFVTALRSVKGLKVVTNGMSSQVFGDYDLVMTAVMREIKIVHQSVNHSVFICKFIAADRSHLLETHE